MLFVVVLCVKDKERQERERQAGGGGGGAGPRGYSLCSDFLSLLSISTSYDIHVILV